MAFLADQVFNRHPAIVEMQGRGIGCPPAHLLEFCARQAGRIALDQEQADAGGALAAGAHRNRQIIRPHARGDEGLLAVDDVMVAVAPSPRAQIGDVGAAARLGDGECGDLFPRQDFGQHPRPDFGTRRARDRRRADGVAHQACGDAAGAGAGELLGRHDLHELVGGNAAILFRKAEAQQADFGGLLIERAGKFAGLVPFMGERRDLLFDETAHHLAKGFVLGAVERACHSLRSPGQRRKMAAIASSHLRRVAGCGHRLIVPDAFAAWH